jgi:hypothetical protein
MNGNRLILFKEPKRYEQSRTAFGQSQTLSIILRESGENRAKKGKNDSETV